MKKTNLGIESLLIYRHSKNNPSLHERSEGEKELYFSVGGGMLGCPTLRSWAS